MASESSRPTPLGVARARFVDGLPRKAGELRGSIALLAATPADEKTREELRRRLHALYASAQVFQIAPLSAALKDAIARLDHARDAKEPLTDDDVDALALLATTLPVLGQAEPSAAITLLPDEAPPSISEFAIPSSVVPPVAVPPAAKVPQVGPRASAPPGHRSTLPLMPSVTPAPVASEHPTPVAPVSPATRRASVRPKATLRGIPASEAPPPRGPLSSGPLSSGPLSSGPLASGPLASEPEGRASAETVVSVLVIDAAEWQAKVRATLPAERFEVLGASDAEEALRLARSSAPDVVLVDHAILMRPGVEVVRRLRDDPLTDFVPVVALVPTGTTVDPIGIRELGADDAITKPFDPTGLEVMLRRLAAGPAQRGALAGLAGEHTIDEVAQRIADEVRRGLSESVDRGRELKVPLGDGAEVLAAAWSAIGRVRAHLAHRSGGRLHFHDARAPGGPAFLALADDDEAGDTSPGTQPAPVSLRDRHVIVADDDPAVVWFFAGLLREEGAIVDEAGDGAEVLERARKKRPDLVISDILMPRLDGFALTRELKRDPALADVPVILLSWKEDFLQRMRELQSGASGYLRKEAAAAQILECVRDVLRPRARLESQLRAGGDVRGRLERTGILPLIATVAQHRPSARITVRDAWNLFEIDLRPDETGAGRMVDLTRTASDGSFTRGPRVVVPLLGATVGRFSVVEADTAVRASIKEPLDRVLRRGAAQIGALVDAVSGKGLALAAAIELDEDVVSSLLRSSPEPMTSVVEALRNGKGPRQLILDGTLAPDDLEAVMLDLARQGAITGVRGPSGEDRLEAAVVARGEIELPVRTPSLMPPAVGSLGPPGIQITTLPPHEVEEEAGEGGLQWLKTEESTGQIVAEAHRLASQPPPRPVAVPEVEDSGESAAEGEGGIGAEAGAGTGTETETATGTGTETETVAATVAASPGSVGGAPASASAPASAAAPASASAPASAPASAAAAPAPAKRGTGKHGARAPGPAKPAPAAASGGIGALGWTFLLALLVVVGYVGFQAFVRPPGDATAETPPETAAEPAGETAGDTPAVGEPATTVAAEPGTPAEPGAGAEAADPAASLQGYGRIVPGIPAELGVTVQPGEGVVVLEPPADGEVQVRIGERQHTVGGEPVAIAMPEGVHEVAFVEGDDLAFRFVRVQAGHTRYVPAP